MQDNSFLSSFEICWALSSGFLGPGVVLAKRLNEVTATLRSKAAT